MKALVWRREEDVRYDMVSDPAIEHPPRDAINKVTSCAICGSDLHLFHHLIPAIATAMVAGITLLDLAAYAGVKAVHRRDPGSERDYSDRSGLPRGAEASRGLARKDFQIPPDYRAEGTVADSLPTSAA